MAGGVNRKISAASARGHTRKASKTVPLSFPQVGFLFFLFIYLIWVLLICLVPYLFSSYSYTWEP